VNTCEHGHLARCCDVCFYKKRVGELEAANSVLVRAVIGADEAKHRLRECQRTEGGSCGQTIDACIARVRYHNVPLSVFDAYEAAMKDVCENKLAFAAILDAAAVKANEGSKDGE